MRPLGFLLILVASWSMPRPAAADPAVVADNDPRFRVLEPAEKDFKPKSLPSGTDAESLSFWQHRIGSDDSPPLLIAASRSSDLVWTTALRDDNWQQLDKGVNNHWTGSIRAQAPTSRTPLWPTPESIDIRLRKDPATGLWLIASLVELGGQLDLNGRLTSYRLRDENSDGKLDGMDDTLQVDLNSNGQFEKLRETFPLTKFFRHQGTRYAVRLDRTARKVDVQSFEAMGTVQLTFDGWEQLEQPPTRVHVALHSSSGIQAVFNDLEPQTLPTGEYHIYAAVLNWEGNEKWRMTFAQWDSQPKAKFTVAANQTTKIPVLGKAELVAEIESLTFSENMWRLSIQPLFKTETGLYLTRASSGSVSASVDGTLIANVQAAADGRVLTTGSTQFACGTFCPINMSWKDESGSQIKLSFDSGPLAGVMTNQIKLDKK